MACFNHIIGVFYFHVKINFCIKIFSRIICINVARKSC